MPQVNIFRWRAGRGWLVLAGGGSWDDSAVQDVEAHVLRRTVSLGPLAYVWTASDIETADRHMDALRELGARTGYLVDIVTESDNALAEQLNEAGVIILADGPHHEALRDAMPGVVLDSIEEAYQRGATVYAVGRSAAMLGAHVLDHDEWMSGFDWLSHALIYPGFTPEDAEQLREWVRDFPDGYGLGLGRGAALALGPLGEVEVWGNGAITVSLGQQYS